MNIFNNSSNNRNTNNSNNSNQLFTTGRNIFTGGNNNNQQQPQQQQNTATNIFSNNNSGNRNVSNNNPQQTTNLFTQQQQQRPAQQQQQGNIFTQQQQQQGNIFTQQTNQQQQQNTQQQPANLFTQQKQTQVNPNQQLNTQQQPQQFIQSSKSPNKPPSQPIPTNALIAQSLYQKHSFVQILQKVSTHQKLSNQQIKFVKLGGHVYFKKDLFKTNLFKTVISKKDHLSFTKSQMIYEGIIPKCQPIDDLLTKLIKNFAFICETNEMNGYFIMKPILRSTGIYTRFYQPKVGLDNKVFEVNVNFLSNFYHPLTIDQQQKQKAPIINVDSVQYLSILNEMIDVFYQEWMAYLNIVSVVCYGGNGNKMMRRGEFQEQNQENEELGGQSGQQQPQQQASRGQGIVKNPINQPQPAQQPQPPIPPPLPQQQPPAQKLRLLRFSDFHQTNIIQSLFQLYKHFSLQQYTKPQNHPYQKTSLSKQRYFQMKKTIFFKISQLIARILQHKYTQEMIMQRQVVSFVETVKYIDDDIDIVVKNSLVQPIIEQLYITSGMRIILALIPYCAYINLTNTTKNIQLLKIYFNLQQIKQKYTKTLSQQHKQLVLNTLAQLKTPMMMPIKLWALMQMDVMVGRGNNNGIKRNRMEEGLGVVENNNVNTNNDNVNFNQNQGNLQNISFNNNINSKLKSKQHLTHLQLWQQYLQKNIKNLTILQQPRFSNLMSTTIITLGIKQMIESQFMKSILVYYIKNLIKNNVDKFFMLWGEIVELEKNVTYQRLESMIKEDQQFRQSNNANNININRSSPNKNNTKKDTQQRLIKLSKMVIKDFQIYIAGKVLQQLLKNDITDQSYQLMTKLLKDDTINTGKNYTAELFEFVDAVKDNDVNDNDIVGGSFSQLQQQQIPQPQPLLNMSPSTIRLKILILQFARHFRLPFTSTSDTKLLQITMMDLNQQQLNVITDFQQQIKFLCKLIRVNALTIQQVQGKLFADVGYLGDNKFARQGNHFNNINNNHSQINSPTQKQSSPLPQQTRGLRTCTLLCLILGKMDVKQVSNIKCLRYIIQTIDTLYTCVLTRQVMMFAISLVFPMGRMGDNQIINNISNINNSYYQTATINSPIKSPQTGTIKQPLVLNSYPLQKIMKIISQKQPTHTSSEQHRQIQKLHHCISHHVNHLIKYCDSLDSMFPLNTIVLSSSTTSGYVYFSNDHPQNMSNQHISRVSIHTIYDKIQKQLSQWQFPTAIQYINNTHVAYRPSDWLYSFVRVLNLSKLLPVDIDTIILLVNKMRIPTQESTAFIPMMEILRVVNSCNVVQQMIGQLKPTIVNTSLLSSSLNNKPQNQKLTPTTPLPSTYTKIVNQKLSNYYPIQCFKQHQLPTHKYTKYQNHNIINKKNNKLAHKQQSMMIKKLCMFIKLIEQVLKIKLQPQYQTYTLLNRTEFIQQIYNLLTNPQHTYQYDITYVGEDTIQQQQLKQTINLHAVIVSMLRLYQYRLKLPIITNTPQLYNQKQQSPYYILRKIQQHSIHTFAYDKNYQHNTQLLFDLLSTSEKVYSCYETEIIMMNTKFFQSVPYVGDWGVESDEVSLKSSVIAIVQLLCEHKAGSLAVKSLEDYSYPIRKQVDLYANNINTTIHSKTINTSNSITANLQLLYNPTLRHLKQSRTKSLIPLLFKHIKQTLSYGSFQIQNKLFEQKSKALQSLSVMVHEDIFYNQIMRIIVQLRIQFVNIFCNNANILVGQYRLPLQTITNLYNKVALFSYHLTLVTINKHPSRVDELINNFFILPVNLLRLLFECLYNSYLIQNNNNLQNLLLVRSFQPIPNYFMQQRLTRITIFKSTIDILCKIIINILQHSQPQHINVLLQTLFTILPLITQSPIELTHENHFIQTLNLIPLQVVMIRNQQQDNIKTTILSQSITQYKYCYRTNSRKYGANFMYSTFLAYHRLRVYYRTMIQKLYQQQQLLKLQQNTQMLMLPPQQFIKRQLYHIQLINCIKSVRFAHDSMVETYLQLMNILVNLGSVGQNVGRYQIDINIPNKHVGQIMVNKYCLQNRYSFIKGLNYISSKSVHQTLAQRVSTYANTLLDYASRGWQDEVIRDKNGDNNYDKQLTSMRRRTQQHNYPIDINNNYTNIFQQPLQKNTIQYTNCDHIVRLLTTLIQQTISYYYHNPTIAKLSQRTIPLRQFISKLVFQLKTMKSIKCTLRVMLVAYEMSLGVYEKLMIIQRQRLAGVMVNNKDNNNISNIIISNKQQLINNHPEITQLIIQQQHSQQKILQSISNILYKCLQKQKPTIYLRGNYCQNNPFFKKQSLFSNPIEDNVNNNMNNNDNRSLYNKSKQLQPDYSRQQVMQNVAIFCSVCAIVLQNINDKQFTITTINNNNNNVQQQIQQPQQLTTHQPQQYKLTIFTSINKSTKKNNQHSNYKAKQPIQKVELQEHQYQRQQSSTCINYVLKLLTQSLQSINNPISRVILFNLCNKFYFLHQHTLVQKWPFYSLQLNMCDQLILQNGYNNNKTNRSNNNNNDQYQFDNNNNNNDSTTNPFWLQKINAIDTYCTLAIINQKYFNKQLLTILVNIIKIDEQFISRQKTIALTSSKGGKSSYNKHMSSNNNDYNQLVIQGNNNNDSSNINKNKYNLRKFSSSNFTIDKLIQYKKLLTLILLAFHQDNWQNPNYSPQTNVLFLEIMNFNCIEFSLQRILPIKRVQTRLIKLIVRQSEGKQQQEQTLNMLNPNSKSIKTTKIINQTNIQQNPSYTKRSNLILTQSTPNPTLSLFHFTAFIHHNQLLYTWLLTIKTGLRHSTIMQQIGGYILSTEQYNSILTNIMNKMDQLYHYYADYVQLFIENDILTQNLIKLYNYIAQQSAYVVDFTGLTVYFDVLQQTYVTQQLITSVIEYAATIMEIARKSRDIQWKCQRNWGKQRNNSLNKCLQLIQKNKVIVGFKQLGLWPNEYNQLREALHQQIADQRNFNVRE